MAKENRIEKRADEICSMFNGDMYSMVRPQAERIAIMEKKLDDMDLAGVPAKVDTGCGTVKRNPVIAEFCELDKECRLSFAYLEELAEMQDKPRVSRIVDMRERAESMRAV